MLYSPLFSHLQKPQMSVSSGEAQFNGKEAVLIGEVSIRHGLGQITAHRIAMVPLKGDEVKKRAALFKISEDVEIQLEGGGCLSCQSAEIDYTKMQGVFLGNHSHPNVVYRHFKSGDAEAAATPLFVVKSRQMKADLIKTASSEDQRSRAVVKDIYALGDVAVTYQQKYSINAQAAHYQRIIPNDLNADVRLAGRISFTGESGCSLSTTDGDSVIADSMEVDTNEQKLSLVHPKGALKVDSHRQQKEGNGDGAMKKELTFSADALIWDHPKQQQHLKGDVHLILDNAIEVKTPYELVLVQGEINGRTTIHTVTAPQLTEVIFNDLEKEVQHKIHCPGRMIIDHRQCCITFENDRDHAPDSNDETTQRNQVTLENNYGEMFADRVEINYFSDGHQTYPVKVILTGAVRLINRFNGHLQEVGGILHYAMADRLEYHPITQEMILSSPEGNRVLFFDKVNNVQMSAPSLIVNKDKQTQRETVRGIGDVRFTFIERELKQLKRYFQLEDRPK
jgi:hypothetical protein